ncbi:MAG: formate-dependent phosphoribosylglycinamide formyltransferase [Deltaproteobacteria bacterium]|nr:formate-dependent phosphoribosylglycinamide formyltransferase [Deltaproteobacteria bacterium]
MPKIGTPNTDTATKALLLGAGELCREIAIEAHRLGLEVIAVDRYEDAPAMAVAHRSHVIHIEDPKELRKLIDLEKPDYIIPGSEHIAAEILLEFEEEGYTVAPSAKAAKLGTDRAGIRELVAHELNLPTSPFRIAHTMADYWSNIGEIGFPCMVKPLYSSSGVGHSFLKGDGDTMSSWQTAQDKAHPGTCGVIIEGLIDFDYEVTILTVRHAGGILFCDPIGHHKLKSNYRESWQPHPMPAKALERAHEMAEKIVNNLGGYGLYSMEFFVKEDEVYFSKVAPRPHDTGMVTMTSQNISECSLHLRAILGLPIPTVRSEGAGAAAAIVVEGDGTDPVYTISAEAMLEPDTSIRLFGKTEVHGIRPMGVALALGKDVDEARKKATTLADSVKVELS